MPKVSTPILIGSIAAAATVGYAYGTGRFGLGRRRPNPELRSGLWWDENYEAVHMAFMVQGSEDEVGVLARPEAVFAELKNAEGWDGARVVNTLKKMWEHGYISEIQTRDQETLYVLTPKARSAHSQWEDLQRDEDEALRENPTGYPMSAGEISEGPHAGKVMYRPKLKDQKGRPRIYVEPGSAEALEERTEDTVALRQEKAGRKRRPGSKAKAPPVKKKPEKAAAKPKPKPKAAAKPKAAPKPKPAAKPKVEAKAEPKPTPKAAKKATKKAGKKKTKKKTGPLKAPPRMPNPGSTAALVRGLEF